MELRQFTWLWNEASKPLYLKPPIHWQALISYSCMDAELCIVLDVWHESKCLHHLRDFRELATVSAIWRVGRVKTVIIQANVRRLELLARLEELILVICSPLVLVFRVPFLPALCRRCTVILRMPLIVRALAG